MTIDVGAEFTVFLICPKALESTVTKFGQGESILGGDSKRATRGGVSLSAKLEFIYLGQAILYKFSISLGVA